MQKLDPNDIDSGRRGLWAWTFALAALTLLLIALQVAGRATPFRGERRGGTPDGAAGAPAAPTLEHPPESQATGLTPEDHRLQAASAGDESDSAAARNGLAAGAGTTESEPADQGPIVPVASDDLMERIRVRIRQLRSQRDVYSSYVVRRGQQGQEARTERELVDLYDRWIAEGMELDLEIRARSHPSGPSSDVETRAQQFLQRTTIPHCGNAEDSLFPKGTR